jgi:hypothetical protein
VIRGACLHSQVVGRLLYCANSGFVHRWYIISNFLLTSSMVFSSTTSDCPSYSFVSESAKSTKSSVKHPDPAVDLPPYAKDNKEDDSNNHARFRAKYSPEFLQEFADKRSSSTGDMQLEGTKYKFVSGPEATDIFNEYIKNSKSSSSSSKAIAKSSHPPIVFAMPTFNSMGRKVLDYYMTYGTDIPKTHALKGSKRRKNFLDHEFNKINQAVNKEYKRMSCVSSQNLFNLPR